MIWTILLLEAASAALLAIKIKGWSEVDLPGFDVPDLPPASDPRLARLSYEQGSAALREQAESLERLRTRSAGFTTAVTAIAAVAGGLNDVSGGEAWLAGLAVVLVGWTVMSGVAVLWPVSMIFTNDSRRMAIKVGWASSTDAERDLAYCLGVQFDANDVVMKRKATQFACQLALGGVAVLAWLLYVWSAFD